MEFLIFYIITILGSSLGDFLLVKKFIKDVADNGYLLDYEKMNELTDKIDINNHDWIVKYIPVVNIFSTFKDIINYNNERPYILTTLNVYGLLNEMTDEEKKEYNKKPSAFNAIKIKANRESKLYLPTTSVLKLDNGKIWYEKSDRDYIILKATGSAKDLSRVSQINLIEQHNKKLIEDGTKYYGDYLTFLNETKNCKNYNEIEGKIIFQKLLQEESTALTVEEAIEELERLEKLNNKSNSKLNEEIVEEEKDKPKKLIKKL